MGLILFLILVWFITFSRNSGPFYRCFSFAALPWYQRKVAAAIFSSPPQSTYKEVRLPPRYVTAHLWLPLTTNHVCSSSAGSGLFPESWRRWNCCFPIKASVLCKILKTRQLVCWILLSGSKLLQQKSAHAREDLPGHERQANGAVLVDQS